MQVLMRSMLFLNVDFNQRDPSPLHTLLINLRAFLAQILSCLEMTRLLLYHRRQYHLIVEEKKKMMTFVAREEGEEELHESLFCSLQPCKWQLPWRCVCRSFDGSKIMIWTTSTWLTMKTVTWEQQQLHQLSMMTMWTTNFEISTRLYRFSLAFSWPLLICK